MVEIKLGIGDTLRVTLGDTDDRYFFIEHTKYSISVKADVGDGIERQGLIYYDAPGIMQELQREVEDYELVEEFMCIRVLEPLEEGLENGYVDTVEIAGEKFIAVATKGHWIGPFESRSQAYKFSEIITGKCRGYKKGNSNLKPKSEAEVFWYLKGNFPYIQSFNLEIREHPADVLLFPKHLTDDEEKYCEIKISVFNYYNHTEYVVEAGKNTDIENGIDFHDKFEDFQNLLKFIYRECEFMIE